MPTQFQCDAGHRWSGDSAAHCPVCGSETTFIQPPAAQAPTRTGGGPAADHAPWAGPPGYTVVGELGRGGMGVVYRAFDPTLKRPVALKVLLGGAHAGSAAEDRFRAEARSVARLPHPNIVQVYEIGECDGLPFMALEFLPGGTLADRLKAGPVFPAQAGAIVERVARGVQAAHDQKVIHRDLKPANILFDAAGEPKVADFGLAKRLGWDDGMTRTGAVLGTPAYMAPEQARGETKTLGPAADVYALGAILYACLAGRPPFQGTTVTDIMRLVVEADPDPPPGPSDLQAVCLKCLEKDPAKRYPSAGALADDLGRFRAGEPVTARRRPAWVRALRKAKRYRVPAAVAAAAVLAAVTVIALDPPADTPVVSPVAAAPEAPPEPVGPRGVDRVAAARARMSSSNNLKELALGIHNFHNDHNGVPAPAITDPKTGRPLLSWRVTLLPYVNHDDLYKQFRLTEPWDSPHNKALAEKMPRQFVMPDANDPPGHTRYRMITGPGTIGDPAFSKPHKVFGRIGPALTTITDGTSLTVMLAEAADAVPWTKPDELEVRPAQPLPRLGGYFGDTYQVAKADGAVIQVSDRVSVATLRAVFSIRGNDLPGADWPDGPRTREATVTETLDSSQADPPVQRTIPKK